MGIYFLDVVLIFPLYYLFDTNEIVHISFCPARHIALSNHERIYTGLMGGVVETQSKGMRQLLVTCLRDGVERLQESLQSCWI